MPDVSSLVQQVRLLALILACVLSFAFVACNGDDDEEVIDIGSADPGRGARPDSHRARRFAGAGNRGDCCT
jgi:hypothetical protein